MRASLLLLHLAAASCVYGFSGDGRETFRKAEAYLFMKGEDERERAAMAAMDLTERLQTAAKLYESAASQAASPREKKMLDSRLATVYNRLSVEFHQRKEFADAIDAARQSLQYAGPSVVLHENIGAMCLDAGDYYNAALELEKAKELAGDTPARSRVVQNLVAAYIQDGKTRDRNSYGLAAQALEEESSREPENPQHLVYLGRCRLLEGDPARALEAWKQARQLRPFDREMEEEFKRLASAVLVKRDFVRNESRHFIIDFDDKAHSNLAQRLLDLFEDAHDELGQRLSITAEASEKISVSVYTSDQFDRTVRVPWAGGVHRENRIDLRVNPKWKDDDYADTVLHEYTHHLISRKAAGKRVPAWAHEGLAMAQEEKLDRLPFVRRLVSGQRSKQLMPIAQLEESFSRLSADQALLAYAESDDFVRYLSNQHGLAKLLKMVELLGEGTDLGAAFQSALGLPYEAAEAAWRSDLDERVETLLAEIGKARAK